MSATTDAIPRFMKYRDGPPGRTADECWEWKGTVANSGYGIIYVGTKKDGRCHTAHRLGYLLAYGSIPEGLVVDHLCRNTLCVNATHLEAVTQAENNRRNPNGMAAKTHCVNGHEYTEDSTYRDPKNSYRQCKICRAEAQARIRAKRKT